MSSIHCQILSSCIERDTQSIIITLLGIIWRAPQEWYIFPYPEEISSSKDNHTFPTNSNWPIICHNLSGDIIEEEVFIRKLLTEYDTVIIYTQSTKQSLFWQEYLWNIGIRASSFLPPEKFCSLLALGDFISQAQMNRKEIIFSIKMLFWLEETQAWLLDELRFYGDERKYMKFMGLWATEYSDFREKHIDTCKNSSILIAHTYHKSFDSLAYSIGKYTTIVRDVYRMEDIYRKQETRVISFSEIHEHLDILQDSESLSCQFFESVRFSLVYIEHILKNIHTRPTGEMPNPPWEYGETYYWDQDMLWKGWWTWLMICMQSILFHLENAGKISAHMKRFEKRIFLYCIDSIEDLLWIIQVKNKNLSLILSIVQDETRLSIIPRDMSGIIRKYIETNNTHTTHLMNYGKGGMIIESFLKNECGVVWNESSLSIKNEHSIQIRSDLREIIESWNSIVILSTSNKHLRSLTNEIKRYFDGKIFTQGISWWKWKIVSLFEKQSGGKILLGTIDNWIDESSVWKHCDTIVLAKMPFDPPTDPYYLARTVGMKNNFEDYSCPIAIGKINMLIWRTRSASTGSRIYCLDDRLTSTIWWSKIFQEVL